MRVSTGVSEVQGPVAVLDHGMETKGIKDRVEQVSRVP